MLTRFARRLGAVTSLVAIGASRVLLKPIESDSINFWATSDGTGLTVNGPNGLDVGNRDDEHDRAVTGNRR